MAGEYSADAAERFRVVMMAMHPRVGAQSSLNSCDPMLLQTIVRTSARNDTEIWHARIREMISWLQSNAGRTDNLLRTMTYRLFLDRTTRKWMRSVFELQCNSEMANAQSLIQDLVDRDESMYLLDHLNSPLLLSLVMYEEYNVECSGATNDTGAETAIVYLKPTLTRTIDGVPEFTFRCNPNKKQVIGFAKMSDGHALLSKIHYHWTSEFTTTVEACLKISEHREKFATHAVESHIHMSKLDNKLNDTLMFWNHMDQEAFRSEFMCMVNRHSKLM